MDEIDGLVHVYARTPAGHLVESVNNNAGGHPWNAYDLTFGAGGGGPIAGDPAILLDYADHTTHVYVNTPSGHLVEYANDNAGGHAWNAYDLSFGAHGGGPITGNPTGTMAFVDGLIHLYAQTPAGDLVEYVNDNAGGHLWNVYDLSFGAGGGGAITSAPTTTEAYPFLHVYARNSAGHLVEYVNNNTGGHLWNSYDLSFGAGGGGPVSGTPDTLINGEDGLLHVYVNTPEGHLVEYVDNNTGGHPWNAYDLSQGAGNGGAITGMPGSVATYNFGASDHLVHVYAWTPGGDVVEYVPDNVGGHPWNVYDLSVGTGVR